MKLPVFSDVLDAAQRIKPHAVVTPLVEHPVLNAQIGGRVFLKLENLQRVGAFKFRGAYNAASRIDLDTFPGGAAACSSGNHAQGIAEAARLLGIDAAIVMPHDAPRIKVARTRASGADVIIYDRNSDDREGIANAVGVERKAQFVAPYDNFHVIAGQGTVGLEICAQIKEAGAAPDAILVPSSGAGLTSGVALAVHNAFPNAAVHPVEPMGFDRVGRSLATGSRVSNSETTGTICDSLLSQTMGALNFGVLSAHGSTGLAVTDDEVRDAMQFAFRELKQVVEPGGAAGLAALLSGKIDGRNKTVVVVISGGNVDPDLFAEIISSDADGPDQEHQEMAENAVHAN